MTFDEWCKMMAWSATKLPSSPGPRANPLLASYQERLRQTCRAAYEAGARDPMTTFDEWYDAQKTRPGDNPRLLARAAYEAGARETEAQLGLYGERDRSRARVGALEEALVLAAIPLEAIKASVKWELSTDINAAVGTALIAIRRVLANRPEGE